ncbi:hypothetical protein F511_12643 [Dorcoceras hygrometricum]|uniref:Uncharacterized protein n=1 Tax=Dorcoceras hygrometricum TaxID=472368 RepID=A0A2Z7CMW1_9LAMI|nr:hypothetical protein F511_12643 [Dorcoceras hygrometricum]
MVKVFKALESSGLRGFLGCTAAVYEEDFQNFFSNTRLERYTVISTVKDSCSTPGYFVQHQFGAVALPRAPDILEIDFNERMKSLELSVEYLPLSSQKVVAHLKRADDVKEGESSSSGSRKGESSNGDRYRDSSRKCRCGNRSQQGDEVRELPARPQQYPGTLRAKIQGTASTDLSSRDKCVYATDAMINTETYTLRKAYTATSIITHAQSKAVKQAHIRTSSLLCYNYYNRVPSNTDLTPDKPITTTNQETKHRKATAGSYELDQRYTIPSISTDSSKQTQASSKRPKAPPNEVSQQEESSATTLTSIESSYRRQSEKTRFGEQKLGYRDRVQQSGNILNPTDNSKNKADIPARSRSRNRSHSTPKQISTKTNDVAKVHYRNWTRHPLLRYESLAQEESETQNGVAL